MIIIKPIIIVDLDTTSQEFFIVDVASIDRSERGIVANMSMLRILQLSHFPVFVW